MENQIQEIKNNSKTFNTKIENDRNQLIKEFEEKFQKEILFQVNRIMNDC